MFQFKVRSIGCQALATKSDTKCNFRRFSVSWDLVDKLSRPILAAATSTLHSTIYTKIFYRCIQVATSVSPIQGTSTAKAHQPTTNSFYTLLTLQSVSRGRSSISPIQLPKLSLRPTISPRATQRELPDESEGWYDKTVNCKKDMVRKLSCIRQ